MAWRRVLESDVFVVEQQDDTPATVHRFRIWRRQSPFAEVTVRVDFPDEAGNSLVEEIIIQPVIIRRRRNPAVSAALDPQELLRVVWETLPYDLRR
jgi:hypothetical protein